MAQKTVGKPEQKLEEKREIKRRQRGRGRSVDRFEGFSFSAAEKDRKQREKNRQIKERETREQEENERKSIENGTRLLAMVKKQGALIMACPGGSSTGRWVADCSDLVFVIAGNPDFSFNEGWLKEGRLMVAKNRNR